MWKYKKFNKVARIIISVFCAFCVITAFMPSEDSKSTDSTAETTAETPTTAETTTETPTTEVPTTTETTTEATTAKKKKLTKKDYNPQITYNDLARKPDKYEYKRITFQGRVIQVIEDDDMIRFYGISGGLVTYESTMGGNITIPSAVAEKVKILNN